MPTVMINGKKHTPGSNTLKRMKRKAAAEAAMKPKAKAKKTKEKPPIPATRKKKPVEGLRVPKGPMSPGGKRGGVAAHTKGGNAGNKTSTVLGIGPKAKLSTDAAVAAKKKYNERNGKNKGTMFENF